MTLRHTLAFLMLTLSLTPGGAALESFKVSLRQPATRNPQPAIVRVAVLDMGETETGRRAAAQVAKMLTKAPVSDAQPKPALLDRELARAGARGVGYKGSLNLTLREARDLGAAIGCDFFVTGDAQTLRRSSSARPVYFESYASIFVVSTRTGRLARWERPFAEASTPEEAEALLLAMLDASSAARQLSSIAATHERERVEQASVGEPEAVLDLSNDGDEGRHRDVREPAPYRRLRPAYTDEAARAEAEATVDASVEIGADGEVSRVEIVRWAGFGLDEAVASTVRQLRFRPAMRDGVPVPVRVLLRYNFRRPRKKD